MYKNNLTQESQLNDCILKNGNCYLTMINHPIISMWFKEHIGAIEIDKKYRLNKRILQTLIDNIKSCLDALNDEYIFVAENLFPHVDWNCQSERICQGNILKQVLTPFEYLLDKWNNTDIIEYTETEEGLDDN